MKVVVVLGGLLLSFTFARADLPDLTPSAKVAPPSGWLEDKATAAERLEQLRSAPVIEAPHLRQWMSPEGDASLQLLAYALPRDNRALDAVVDELEREVVRGTGSAHQVQLTRSTQGHTVIVDHVVDTRGVRLHMRRHYAAANDQRFHVATTICTAPPERDATTCKLALESFAWLIEPVSPVMAKTLDIAYLVGQIIGYGLIAALIVLLVVRAIRKKPTT